MTIELELWQVAFFSAFLSKQEDFFVVLWKKPRYYGMVIYIGRSLQSDFCEREEKHEPYY